MKKQNGFYIIIIMLILIIISVFYLLFYNQIMMNHKIEKTNEGLILLKKTILSEYELKSGIENKLMSKLPEKYKKNNKIYIEEIDSYISLSGMTEEYPMSIITIENMPYDVCKPLISKIYSQFDQLIPYSQKGGIGTCYSTVSPKKPDLLKIQDLCIQYENKQKVWLGLLIKTNSGGGCNIPD